MSTVSSIQELHKIRTAVNQFMKSLNRKISETADSKLRSSFKNVKERMEKYWEKLFADPLVVHVNGKEKSKVLFRNLISKINC